MIIKTPDKEIVHVFLISWDSECSLVEFLYDDSYGLHSLYIDEIEIIDPSFNYRTVFFSNDHTKMIAHWALIEKELLDPITDCDQEAFRTFVDILKDEGELDSDFCKKLW